MAKRKQPLPGESGEDLLFKLPEQVTPATEVRTIDRPIWTENKARLIERYLYYFVMITKHGIYIDGFAGPQSETDDPDLWSARLVLESEPRWFRDFHLFDINPQQVRRLEDMVSGLPPRDKGKKEPKRTVEVREGDFNVLVHELLESGKLSERQATFCLLDQRTFECHWSTVQALAAYKPADRNKIELFYFLPSGWLARSMAGTTVNTHIIDQWWGGSDWNEKLMADSRRQKQAEVFSQRFVDELGYKSVVCYPIYERADAGGGNVMYNMIHATDHPEAPKLMRRAYDRAVGPKERMEDLLQEFSFVEDVPDA